MNSIQTLNDIAAELSSEQDVTVGKWFGKPCLKVGGKVFAALWGGDMAFKLAGEAHAKALHVEGAHLFDPRGKGHPMKEWVQLPAAQSSMWSRFARLACEYVAGAAQAEKDGQSPSCRGQRRGKASRASGSVQQETFGGERPMTQKTALPFGLWPSPVTPASLAQSLRLSDVAWDDDGETLVWLEGRSDRGVLACATPGQAFRDLTSTLSVRARVGYGGGDMAVGGGYVYFAALDGKTGRDGSTARRCLPGRQRRSRRSLGTWLHPLPLPTGAGWSTSTPWRARTAWPSSTPRASAGRKSWSAAKISTCSPAGTPTARAWPGSRGTIPTCPGTARCSRWPPWTRAAPGCPPSSRSRPWSTSRTWPFFSPNSRPTAARWPTSRTRAAGATCGCTTCRRASTIR